MQKQQGPGAKKKPAQMKRGAQNAKAAGIQRRAQLTQAAAKGAKNKRANAVAARRGLGQATPKAKRGGKQAAFQFKGSGVAAARVAPAARGVVIRSQQWGYFWGNLIDLVGFTFP